ncbi:MAG: NF038122 family metalloprotease [Patescibacteria group bacterium]|nr:NF038122 family metalloprotease [Patescibacteria group bacterium]
MAGNQAAIDAFQRAADLWAARISDPIAVTINIDMADLGSPNIIGQASSVSLQTGYTNMRSTLVADAAAEPDDAVVASLPTAAQFAAHLPTGFSLNGDLMSTKANLKAMGFAGLDTQFGASDGTITFNSTFAFDFDNSNGVTANTMDFETVAAHEIGHILGFVSQVDTIDYYLNNNQPVAIAPSALDLFRFDRLTGDNPDSLADFATDYRWLVPGSDAIFDQILAPWGTLLDAEIPMSTGRFNGDGWQASHWEYTELGLMRPALAYGQMVLPNEADFRALDLIGWDILPVPEPGAFSLMLTAALAALGLARRRR